MDNSDSGTLALANLSLGLFFFLLSCARYVSKNLIASSILLAGLFQLAYLNNLYLSSGWTQLENVSRWGTVLLTLSGILNYVRLTLYVEHQVGSDQGN